MKKHAHNSWILLLSLILLATSLADADAIPTPARAGWHRPAPKASSLFRRFRSLQKEFAARGRVYVPGKPKTIVVMPSLSLDPDELAKVKGAALYEERMLYNILHLRDTSAQVRYLSSHRIDPTIVSYYLDLLPAAVRKTAPSRLKMISVDPQNRFGNGVPLSLKLQKSPKAMARVLKGLRLNQAHLYPFNVNLPEAQTALKLGIPILGARPEHAHRFGSKAGCRRTFAEAGVPHPAGITEVRSVDALVQKLARFVEDHPATRRVVVKLNDGFSGEGNAMLGLEGLAKLKGRAREQEIARRLPKMKFMASAETWAHYRKQIPKLGAIAEAFIEGKVKRSPSVQVYIGPGGHVEILSTYEQILGGPGGQEYLGGPGLAHADYRQHLQEVGLKVGKRLAKEGVMGRFAIDFMAVKRETSSPALAALAGKLKGDGPTGWDVQAIEINLRAGGTTHPTNMAKLLLNGHYDMASGAMVSGTTGRKRFYMGHDNVDKEIGSDKLQGLSPADVMGILKRSGLHYDGHKESGVVLHLMGAIKDYGKVGFTVIGATPDQVDKVYKRTMRVLAAEGPTVTRVRR
ncbi:MAG: carboxylate-amine ligase [Deltaproteobacteria bacterium]|nr:carboxylate-amine ligase [Deltaproteobacteria bacterium]